MADYAIFFQHYDLAQQGRVQGITCINEDHDILHPFIDLNTQKIYLECLLCDYRINPGTMMADVMRKEVQDFNAEFWADWDEETE